MHAVSLGARTARMHSGAYSLRRSARLLSTRTTPLLLSPALLAQRTRPQPALSRAFSWSWGSTPASAPAATDSTVLTPSTPPAPAVQATVDPSDATAAAVASPPASVADLANAPPATTPTPDLTPAAIPPPADLSVAPSLPSADALLSDVPTVLEPGALVALGLSSGFPSGWFTQLLDYLHLTAGLTWPGTMLAATLLTRVPMAFAQAWALRTTSRIQAHAKPLEAIQAELKAAQARRDILRVQVLGRRYQTTMAQFGVGPAKIAAAGAVSLANLPLQIGLFLAVRRLAALPLLEMTQTSFAWVPSLTEMDPYFILPILNLLAIQASVSLAKLDSTSTTGAHVLNAMRLVSIAGTGWLATQSAAINLLVLITASTQALQTFLLRAPGIRRKVGIAVVPRDQVINPSMLETVRAARKWFEGAVDDAKGQARK